MRGAAFEARARVCQVRLAQPRDSDRMWQPVDDQQQAKAGTGDTGAVARVSPDDDDIQRYVLQWYAYDPQRHERRHQVLAAFDNEREFQELFDARCAELNQRKASGDNIDPRDHYSGAVKEPGYQRRHQIRRLIWRAGRHGAGERAVLTRLGLSPEDWLG